jgi:hypothetical protein
MERQFFERPPGELTHEEDAQGLLTRQPGPPGSGILRTPSLEVLLNEFGKDRLRIQQRAHGGEFVRVWVRNPWFYEWELR